MITTMIKSSPYLARLSLSLFWMYLTLRRRVHKTRKAFEKQLILQGMSKEDAKRLSACFEELKDNITGMLRQGMTGSFKQQERQGYLSDSSFVQNLLITRQIAKHIHRFRSLSFLLNIDTFHEPLSCCLVINHSTAVLIRWSSILNSKGERESSEDNRSVNQKGKENLVQKLTIARSGYTSRLKNRDAKSFPAVFASFELRNLLWAAKARSTTPVTK